MNNLAVQVNQLPSPGPLPSDTFTLVEQTLPPLNDGEFLMRVIYLSIDAGSRGQLDDRGGYVIKTGPGQIMSGSGAVGQVIESRHPDWREGDYLATTMSRWSTVVRLKGSTPFLTRIDTKTATKTAALEAYLGILGMVGFTAWVGMMQIAKPKPSDCVLVSVAAGATGSAAGQFAKASGARVIGIAGGSDKCSWVKEELGFDDCMDYKVGDIAASIARHCPNGVDVYYDNVGGAIQQAAFDAMNTHGRIALCGMVGQYSGEGEAPGPNLMAAIIKRLSITGFLANDHIALFPEFQAFALDLYQQGKLKHHATVTKGIENIHEAINSLTGGKNIGKQLCQIGDLD